MWCYIGKENEQVLPVMTIVLHPPVDPVHPLSTYHRCPLGGVWPPRVRFTVFQHVVLAYEPLAAGVARERLLARVQTHVPSQVRLVIELFGALVALVGLIAGVFLDVLLVDLVDGEAFAAPLTLEGFVAAVEGLVVLGEVAGFVEDFVAVEAFVDLFGGGGGGGGGEWDGGGDLGAAVFVVGLGFGFLGGWG